MAEKSRRQQIEEMLAEEPHDAFLRYCLGMEYVGAGQHEEAARCFLELLRIDPDYIPAYQQAGKALQSLGRTDEAVAAWRAGIDRAAARGGPDDLHAAAEMEGWVEELHS
jgi:tetratricopeptide (TPR) repeat protein